MKGGRGFQNTFMWFNSRKLCFKLNLETFFSKQKRWEIIIQFVCNTRITISLLWREKLLN